MACALMYAGHDIADAQFAIRVRTNDHKKPTAQAWMRLEHLARYMMGNLGDGVLFEKTAGMENIMISTDTDWAGCRRTWKSVGMTVLRLGKCLLWSSATAQSVHVQSSGESEFYGNGSGISAGLGLRAALTSLALTLA